MSPEDKIYRELMIKGSKVPEGWGRSQVGSKVVITRPKSAAMANPMQDFSLDKNQIMDDIDNSEMREAVETPDDYALTSGDFTPDTQGFIGGYHKDDLKDQFMELQAQGGMEDLLSEIEKEKNIYDPQRKEANRFLEYSIRQGMGK